ncbi:hypothetical protein GCM10023321_65870 [Pseudonocardia eucalypti]|uniref:Uncharacterized protein n=1 Tax=Pseudonocardia eucalypti TaxID=648755 RepID=A0ABP9QZI7_9PSEU|nr:hypothetical protein [Pseudonocardia eucalypti]
MTSPADRYRVADEDLAKHETHLNGLSGRMRQATRAASPISPAAYGLIGQIFAARTADAETKAAQAVNQLAQAVNADGTRIKDTRIAYLGNELELSRRMNRTYPQGNDVDMRPGDQRPIPNTPAPGTPGGGPSGKAPGGNGGGGGPSGKDAGGSGGKTPGDRGSGGSGGPAEKDGTRPDQERTANSGLKDALDGRREAERKLDRLDDALGRNEQRQNALDGRREDLEHRLHDDPGKAERKRIERELDGLDRERDRLDREHDRLERDHRHADRDYERADRQVDRQERADRNDADRNDRSGESAKEQTNAGPAMQLGGVPQWPTSPTRSLSNQSRRDGSRAPESSPT